MNNKLLNTQIESLNTEHGAEIVKFYDENGFDTRDYTGGQYGSQYRFYGVDKNGFFDNRREDDNPEIKTITLDEAKALVNETPYPKVMKVWDSNGYTKSKRVVFMEKNGEYIAWACAETIEDAEKVNETTPWGFAEDIEDIEEPLPDVHLTMEQVADLAKCKVEQLKISK